MKKLTKNQSGFGAIEGFLVILTIVIIGGIGWYIWQSKNNTNDGQMQTIVPASTKATQNKNSVEKSNYKLIDGYVVYKYTNLGFSIAYPKDWGDLSNNIDTTLSYTVMSKYFDNTTIGDSWLQGYFGFNVHDNGVFKINTQKYGAIISPTKSGSGYDWKVTELNPDDTTNKLGVKYNVKHYSSVSGVTLYDFTSQDEGATTSRFVFAVKDKFVTVSLPAILRQNMATVSAKDFVLYTSIAKNIQNSITLSE